MRRVVGFFVRYPLVGVTLAVGVIGLVLLATPLDGIVPWLVGGFAALVALREGVSMVRSMLRREFGLDLLALIAIISTIAVGEYWAALIVVLMLTGGEALEDFAAGRANRELKALLDRSPQVAHRVEGDALVDIAADDVRVGDRILVRPSEVIPVDGLLLSATGTFDESSITGESLPVDRERGSAVSSGAVNGAGVVEIEATALAADSQYQRIVALVREATASTAPLVRLADRYAVPFTLVSLGLAVLGWAISGDPVRFAEVLVVATPCPLLIAAPVAFMGGMGRAAKEGIVMKSAGVLETLARVRTAVFDKTGTLTSGMPELVRVDVASSIPERELLALVGAAERASSHVLAQALRAEIAARGIVEPPVGDAEEVATTGVRAVVDGRTVWVGKPGFVAEHVAGLKRAALETGEAAVYVGVDGSFAGTLILRDQPRPEARETLAELAALGIQRTLVVTGDVADTAESIAAEVGIDEVHAECRPEDKVRILRELPDRPVMMTGDGVNDAPVLAVAEVGIALGARGTTVASESADIVLLLDDLNGVARAVAIGQRTVAIALQSIWIGIIISIGLMLFALTGSLPAIVGAGLQEVVDLVAILAALRALRPGRGERSVTHEHVGAGVADARPVEGAAQRLHE
ncbi:heavy metal translocating P-type ATPase [uncultured Schumannella sp.]|uniref:heavy metal translocating P-type ATPase n=1 Tax=uncultured Schumannella sp. TaxID=1195956 RepID=UPI0025D3191A|nr:heavy metal translocating P-type ATPase [uncultured Schumannella sp.]